MFDLLCSDAHVFEAWFGSSADYEAQVVRGLVTCPICGSGEVGKAVMAPQVAAKDNRGAMAPSEVKALLGRMAEAQRQALSKSEHVGDRFAQEARAIHLGEAEARSIHGRATRKDAEALREEGVPVASLPLPIVPPESEN